jgi:cell division protein FtsB
VDPFAKPGFRTFALTATFATAVMTAVVPARALVREHREISQLRQTLAVQQGAIDQLQSKKVRLRDRAYVEALVRARLNYVFPGEIGFVVLDKETSTAITSVPGALVPNSDDPWYSKLWTSAKLADQPQKKNDPLVVGSSGP